MDQVTAPQGRAPAPAAAGAAPPDAVLPGAVPPDAVPPAAVPPGAVHGISHVTGSGLLNIPRLKKDVRYVLDAPLPVPPVFRDVQAWGGVAEAETGTYVIREGIITIPRGTTVPDGTVI